MQLNKKEQQARQKICLPLDGLATLNEARARVEELSPVVGLFKVGKESYTRFGPAIIKMVQGYDSNVFLDLKYHDIPNTVSGAANAATHNSVWMFNVHASGGREMLKSAVKAAQKANEIYGIPKPKTIGVTVLTSIGPAEYLDINKPLVPLLSYDNLKSYFGMKTDDIELQKEFAEMLTREGYSHLVIDDEKGLRSNVIEQEVLNLARMSNESGLDGVVCSAADLYAIKEHLPSDFIYVTPGIKGPNTPAGVDQKRVFTPGKAIEDGSTYLVIGRAITGQKTSDKRLQAGYEILQDMAKHL